MKRLKAFKFELMPSGIQRRNMHFFARWCCFVFNEALVLQQSNYAQGIFYMSYAKLSFFAKRSGLHKFKKKHWHDSFRYPAADHCLRPSQRSHQIAQT